MKIAFVIFFLPILAYASVSHIYTWGRRQLDDRAFIVYNETQAPNENHTVTFYFEYKLEGKYFTALMVEGEPIFVSNENLQNFYQFGALFNIAILGQ